MIIALVVVALLIGALALSRHRRFAAALCGVALLIALTKLTIGVHTHSRVTGLDAATMSWFAAHQFSSLNWVAG